MKLGLGRVAHTLTCNRAVFLAPFSNLSLRKVWNLTMGMLGSLQHPVLHAKAKETHCLLGFAASLLTRHRDFLRGQSDENRTRCDMLLQSGQHALKFDDVLKQNDRNLNVSVRSALMRSYLSHVYFFQRAGGECRPKHHAMVHCIQRAGRLGNPRHYHTYRDESLNGHTVDAL
jgi:hypothetical protein